MDVCSIFSYIQSGKRIFFLCIAKSDINLILDQKYIRGENYLFLFVGCKGSSMWRYILK